MTWLILLLGVVVGMVSGVVGIGGGILFVPALVLLVGMDQAQSTGDFPGRIACTGGDSGILGALPQGQCGHSRSGAVGSGFLLGGYLGAIGAQHISEVWLRRVFALTLIGVGGRMLFKW